METDDEVTLVERVHYKGSGRVCSTFASVHKLIGTPIGHTQLLRFFSSFSPLLHPALRIVSGATEMVYNPTSFANRAARCFIGAIEPKLSLLVL